MGGGARAVAKVGMVAGRSRAARMSLATSRSVMNARTRRRPPQGQARRSSEKTLWSKSAHGKRARTLRPLGSGAAGDVGSVACPVAPTAASVTFAGARATTWARRRAREANTPAYLTRCRRGGGRMPARRRRNATGERIRCVRPSGQARFNRYDTWPEAVTATRSPAKAGLPP